VAIIDWYSRRVLSFRLSRSLDTGFCRDALRAALKRFGKPEYFNTDQGSQFTEKKFVAILEKKKITISMDGRGRVFDNIFVERLWRSVKYEDVYIKCYESFYECEAGLSEYFRRFNNDVILKVGKFEGITFAKCDICDENHGTDKPITQYELSRIANIHICDDCKKFMEECNLLSFNNPLD
jgi:transposase InsO family protein